MTQNYFNKTLVQNKLGLLNLAQELGNISRACKIMGVSRDTFYRYEEAKENGGVDALLNQSRRVPNYKNRVPEEIENLVVAYAVENPAHGQTRASNELTARGNFISPTGVRGVWLRHNLETLSKRLTNLEKVVGQKNGIYTENQLKALERKEQQKEAHGEIETEHPGYLVAQDTYYVGTIKGVGRIYQQTVIDTYSKVAFAKLYQMKTALTAADVLNDKVLPFFEEQELPILRMLTDRGTEFCGRPEDHEYQLFLALKDIDHSRTKARSPQTNGIAERFHKTMLEEFYSVAFRKKIYQSLAELQRDLDEYVKEYNTQRTHQGKMCCGRTPMATLLDGKKIWLQKNLQGHFQQEEKHDLSNQQ